MSRCVMLAVLLLVFGQRGQGQLSTGYPVADIPASLKSRADAVVRQEVIIVDMLAPTKVRYRVTEAITVFNKAGERRARLVIHYDKSIAIKGISGKVFDGEGFQVGKFNQRDFTDESAVNSFSLYEDDRVKHFLPSVTTYPYTVEYQYELEFKQNLILPAWRPDAYWDVAVEHSQYTFICTESDEVRIRAVNYTGKPETATLKGRKMTTWTMKGVPAQRYEPYSPDPDSYKTVVKVAPVEFSYYKHTGRYSDWEQLGKWAYEALLREGMTLPDPTVREVNRLVEGMASDREKARALYAYLQRKVRYVSVQIGIGGFKPTPAIDVDRLGYGDCKGLVNYMQALLTAVGIPSYYCVVHAGNTKRDLQPDFAGMEQGNHIILCLPFENDTTWLECTNQRIPFGYLGSFTDDRTVVALTPQGGKLLRTPSYSTEGSFQNRNAVLALDGNGTLAGRVETLFAAGQYDNHLEIAESNGTAQVKLLKDAYDIDHIAFSNIGYERRDENGPILVEQFDVAVPKYAPDNDGKVFLIPNLFSKQSSIPALKSRKLPVYINRGYTDEDRITYVLPEGYALLSGQTTERIESPFGLYTASLAQEGDALTYIRTFALHGGTFPAGQYTEFHEFMNRVHALDKYKAIIGKPAP